MDMEKIRKEKISLRKVKKLKGENNMPYHYGHGKDKKRKNKPKKNKMGKRKKRR